MPWHQKRLIGASSELFTKLSTGVLRRLHKKDADLRVINRVWITCLPFEQPVDKSGKMRTRGVAVYGARYEDGCRKGTRGAG